MKLIIDTCNVLHRTGILPPELAGVDEEGLAELIQHSRYRENPLLLVCDGGFAGRSGVRTRNGIQYHYSGSQSSADAVIIQLIKASNTPKHLLVITSDRAIAAQARKRRCRILDSDAFLAHLAHDNGRGARPETPDRPVRGPSEEQEIDAWMDKFQLEEELRSLKPSQAPLPPPEPPTPDPTQDVPPGATPRSTPQDDWEQMTTEELLRRFERGSDTEPDRP